MEQLNAVSSSFSKLQSEHYRTVTKICNENKTTSNSMIVYAVLNQHLWCNFRIKKILRTLASAG